MIFLEAVKLALRMAYVLAFLKNTKTTMKLLELVTTVFLPDVAGVRRFIQKSNRLFETTSPLKEKTKRTYQNWALSKAKKMRDLASLI